MSKELLELEELKKEKAANEKGTMIYEVNNEKIELNFNLVRKTLVKGTSKVTNEELYNFMSLCKYNKINPFLNEVYLIKFGDKCEMILSKEAFIKRAAASGNYNGFEAGIIVERNNEILELEGSFKLENDKLIGGWSKVYRKDQDYPTTAKVAFDEYVKVTKYKNGIWEKGGKPATMIRKVALTQALREAFPSQLGAMYDKDELQEEIKKEKIVENDINNFVEIEPVKEEEKEEVIIEEKVVEKVKIIKEEEKGVKEILGVFNE